MYYKEWKNHVEKLAAQKPLDFSSFSASPEFLIDQKIFLPDLSYTFCLACDIYRIGFVSDFGLYRRQTSKQGTMQELELAIKRAFLTFR